MTLTNLFGHKFTSLYRTQDEAMVGQGVWAKYCGFLTDEQIDSALDKLSETSDWNPSIAKFIRSALDLPDVDQTINRVISDKCTDHVSYEIRKSIGTWDIGHQPQRVIETRIRGMYDDCYIQSIEAIKNVQ